MTQLPAPDAVTDPALLAAVDLARAAAEEQAGTEVGAHVAAQPEDATAVTHLFDADKAGYRGWRWAVTLSHAGPGTPATVSEVVLLPGPDALTAPAWVPWQERVRAGDLGVGDLLPTDPDDDRLVPGYLASDDPAVEEVALEAGLGRKRVMSRAGRLDAADRWHSGEFGPAADMARSAPAHCGTCGFFLPVAGSLGAAFGACGNELAPADGRVVHAEYGCGAHSEAEVEQISPVLVADLIYDDATVDYEPKATRDAEPEVAEEAAEPVAEAADEQAEVAGEAAAEVATEPAAAEVEPVAPAAEAAVVEDVEPAAEVEAVEPAVEPAAEAAEPAVEPAAEAMEPAVEPAAEPAAAETEPAPRKRTRSRRVTRPTAPPEAQAGDEPADAR